MASQSDIKNMLSELKQISDAGFALAYEVNFTTPRYLFQTYPKPWLDHYSQNGLVMSDPTVQWGMENTGQVDWDLLRGNDTAGVLSAAAEHGLNYGMTCAAEVAGKRSLGSFARSDRPFSSDEVAKLTDGFENLRALLIQVEAISPETAAALRELSVSFTHGDHS